MKHEEIETKFFQDCLDKGSVSQFCGNSIDNLYVIINQLEFPTWEAILKFAETSSQAATHEEIKKTILFYLKKYRLADEPIFRKNLSEIISLISHYTPIGEIYDNFFEFAWHPCVCCGKEAEEAHEILNYKDKNYIQIPICPICLENKVDPDKERIIDMLALYSNRLENLYNERIEPIPKEAVTHEYIFNG
jgi:hypothetical protein